MALWCYTCTNGLDWMDGRMDLRVLIIMIYESFMIILSADLDVHCWPCFDHIFTLGKRFNTHILFRLQKLVDNSRCRLYIFNVIMVVINAAIVIIIVIGIVILHHIQAFIYNVQCVTSQGSAEVIHFYQCHQQSSLS